MTVQEFEELVKNQELDRINQIIKEGQDSDFAAWIRWRIRDLEQNIMKVLPEFTNEAAVWKALGQLQVLRSLEVFLFSEVKLNEEGGTKDE